MLSVTLEEAKLKRLIKNILGIESKKLRISVQVAAKVFVGELVERAIEVAAEEGPNQSYCPATYKKRDVDSIKPTTSNN